MDLKTPVRRSISRTTENGNVMTVTVQEADPITNLALLEIKTQVFDPYNGVLLEPRVTQHFLPKTAIQSIGKFLFNS